MLSITFFKKIWKHRSTECGKFCRYRFLDYAWDTLRNHSLSLQVLDQRFLWWNFLRRFLFDLHKFQKKNLELIELRTSKKKERFPYPIFELYIFRAYNNISSSHSEENKKSGKLNLQGRLKLFFYYFLSICRVSWNPIYLDGHFDVKVRHSVSFHFPLVTWNFRLYISFVRAKFIRNKNWPRTDFIKASFNSWFFLFVDTK